MSPTRTHRKRSRLDRLLDSITWAGVRAGVLIAAGFVGIGYEAARMGGARPEFLILYACCLGLPAFLPPRGGGV